MMLDEIVRRQKELAEKLRKEREAPKSRKKTKENAMSEETAPSNAATPQSDETKDTKMVGVPVPLALHARMDAMLSKFKGQAGAPRSKKDLMLRALTRYLDEYDTAESVMDILNAPAKPLTERLKAAVDAAKASSSTPGHPQARLLHDKLRKEGYNDFFVAAGDGELIVYHSPTVFIGPGALPKTFDGYLVRTKETANVPAADVLGVGRNSP
jgi:hypothetical protein